MEILWETPIPARRGRGAAPRPEALELKQHPGEWARLYTFPKTSSAATTATAIRKGERAGFTPAGAFESVSRTVDGRGLVYARYIGEPTS